MSAAGVLCALATWLVAGAGPTEEELTQEESAGAPLESFAPASTQPSARVFASVRGLLGVDTRFEPPPPDAYPEHVVELRGRASLGVDTKLSEQVRVRLEGKALWRGAARAGLERAKASFEPLLGDAFVDLYGKGVDLRVGSQVLSLGANPALAPADALGPRDLRESFLQGEPEDIKLAVFAVRAQGELGPLSWMIAYVPFFTPDRQVLFGQDEGLLQPGWGVPVPPLRVDESVEDALQPVLLETRRPQASPFAGDVGLRAGARLLGGRVGASWLWMNEKLPQVRVDPELAALLEAVARGREPDPAVALSVESRLRAGERLYTGTYARTHVLSLEASRVLGPAQLDLDLGFTPGRTFYTDAFESVRRPALTWVLGATQAEDSLWLYNVTYLGMAIFGLEAQELLALLEPGTARGAPRTALFHLLVASVGRRLLDGTLELSARVALEPIQGSFALGPRVSWEVREGVTLLLAAELYAGSPYSPFGYFRRNNQVLAGVRADLF